MSVPIILDESDIECIANYIDHENCDIDDILIEITTQADKRKTVCKHIYQKHNTIPECFSCILCGKLKE